MPGVVAVEGRVVAQHARACLPRRVHGNVGAADELTGVVSVLGRQRDADACVDGDGDATDRGRQLDAPSHRMGERDGLVGGRRSEDERELVPFESRDGRTTRHFDDSVGEIAQELVPGVVAERVVDLLEPVEIDEHDRHVLVFAQAADRRRQLLVEHLAIRQPGQRIVRGPVADLVDVAP